MNGISNYERIRMLEARVESLADSMRLSLMNLERRATELERSMHHQTTPEVIKDKSSRELGEGTVHKKVELISRC